MNYLKPHIYIPIEIFYREINSRILLTLSACLKGFRVYIGTKSGIDQILDNKIKLNIKGGIYLYKGQIVSSPEYINKIKKTCDKFAVIDEELKPAVVNYKKILTIRTVNENERQKNNYYNIS